MTGWKVRGALLAAMLIAAMTLFFAAGDGPAGEGDGSTTRVTRVFKRAWNRLSGNGLLVAEADDTTASRTGGKRSKGKSASTKSGDHRTSCALLGTVMDEERAPIKGAKITVRAVESNWEKTVESDEKGRFRALDLEAGVFNILATHPEYVGLIRPNLNIEPSERPPEIEFRMPLGAVIKGKIKDEAGKPLSGVRVAARRRSLEQIGKGDVYQDDSTYKLQRTDGDGTFTLEGVAVGESVFEFFKRGYELETKIVKVEAKKIPSLNDVVLRKTGRLAGVVMTEEGRPLAESKVTLVRYRGIDGIDETLPPDGWTTTTGADGAFAFGKLFTEGVYDITAENPNYAPGGEQSVPVGTDRVAIKLERGGIIYGTTELIDRDTTPVSVQVRAESVIKGTTVTREVKSTGAGTFRFDMLPYGTYKLDVISEQYESEAKTGVAVERGKAAGDVVVEVYEAATARGRVQELSSEAPIAGAKVTVEASYGTGRTRKKSFTAETNSLGQFELRRLPSGLHSAQAEAAGYARTPGASAQTFTLDPGERKTDIALRLDQGGTVDGVVTTPNGAPLSDATVQLYTASSAFGSVDPKNLKATTDGTGHFKIRGIEFGERLQLYASATHDGYAKSRSNIIDLTAKKRSETVQITMSFGGTITGKVTDERELPIPSVEVVFNSHEFPSDPSSSKLVAHTRPDGSYAIDHAPPGGGGMKVSSSGYVEQSRSVTVPEASITDNVNFRMISGRGISGRVTTLAGKAISNARVSASPKSGATGRDDAITDKEGRYTLKNLGAGNFDLRASFKMKTSLGEQSYVFMLKDIPSGEGMADFDCDVNPAAAGIVKGEDGKGVDKFTLSLRSLTDKSVGQDFVFNLDRNYDAARGIYNVMNIPRGVYSLKVTAQGYEVYEDESVFVGPKMNTALKDIRLKQAGGVFGTLISGKSKRPVNNVLVKLSDLSLPEDDPKRAAASARTDFAGRFHVNTVGAGNYSVAFQHPNYVPLTLAAVRVEKRKPTDLGEVKLTAGGTVQGTVTDLQGEPVSGMEVRASGVEPRKRTRTDGGGNFILQGIPEGRVPIVLEGKYGDRQVYQFQTVMVEPEESETANFMVEVSANLRGTLLASEGPTASGEVNIHPFDENAVVLDRIKYSGNVDASRYSIDKVPSGQYFLWSNGLAAGSPFSLWRNIFLRRGSNNQELAMSGAVLRGQAKQPEGSPVAGVGVQLLPMVDGVKLPQSLYDNLVQRTNTNSVGSFRFKNLQSGSYQLLYQDSASNPNGGWMAMPPFFIGEGQTINDYPLQVGGQ